MATSACACHASPEGRGRGSRVAARGWSTPDGTRTRTRNQPLQFGTAAVITPSRKGGVGAVPFRQTELVT
ncbi:hypothetical protein ACH5A3_15640 [Streptomyces echinatus]|uniref:hypothetical protein n=1 Tax=Streptomyces echinatus TaxID=67293 RepID=UPI0037B1D993